MSDNNEINATAFTNLMLQVNVGELISMLIAARLWSLHAFGEGARTEGVIKHIEAELAEIRAKPDDLEEWIDVAILAFDGAWRAGHHPAEIAIALQAKYIKNFSRKWPPAPPEDEPSFHIEEGGPTR